MDFAIALLLFTFTVAVYYGYTNNFQKEERGGMNSVISDAKTISSSLVLGGYPANWDNTSVVRIGIADNQQINTTKLKNFKQLNYSQTKKKFGTVYDYFVFFVNRNGDVLSLQGVCGVGNTLISTTYNIKSAYYYQDPSDSFLMDFMNNTFNADIYFGGQIDQLVSNLSKYGFLVMEQPALSTSTYNQYKSSLENFTSNGGYFMLSGELATAQGKDLDGATFYKKSGQSKSDRNSTVNGTDPYLAFNLGDSIVFAQAYYVQNSSSALNFSQIATFNADGNNAVARWKFGNGTVYFFSDFDTSYFNGDIANIVEDAARGLVQTTCNPINITGVPRNKLAKTERYLNYNSDVVKMVVYVWQ